MNNSVRIPGCETFTRPEEISALSKFLGEVKNIQEGSIEAGLFDKTLDPIPGKDTGLIPNIDSLPDYVDKLEDNSTFKLGEDVVELPDSQVLEDLITSLPDVVENVPEDENSESEINSLPEETVQIPDSENKDSEVEDLPEEVDSLPDSENKDSEVEDLPEEVDSLPDSENEKSDINDLPDDTTEIPENENKASEVSNLPEEVLGLSGVKDVELEKELLKLKDIPEPHLSSHVEELKNIPEPRLDNHIEELKDIPESHLDDHIEKLKNIPEPHLDNHVEELKNIPEPHLDNHVEELKDIPEPHLDNHIEELKDIPEPHLSSHVEELKNIPEPRLDNHIEELKDIPEPHLDNHVEKLKNIPEPRLNNHVEELKNIPEPSLDNHVEELKNIPEPELSDYIEELSVTDNNKLSDTVEKLTPTPDDTELSDYLDKLNSGDIPQLSLSYTVEKLHDIESPIELSDHVEKIKGIVDLTELEDKRTSLPGEISEPTLSNKVVELSDGQKELSNLPDGVLSLGEIKDVTSLSNKVVELNPNPKDIELSDVLIGLEVDQNQALSDELIGLIDDKQKVDVEKVFGSDRTVRIKPEPEIEELSDGVLALSDNVHNEVSELSDSVLQRPDHVIQGADPERRQDAWVKQTVLNEAESLADSEIFNSKIELPKDDISSSTNSAAFQKSFRENLLALDAVDDIDPESLSSDIERTALELQQKSLISKLSENEIWNRIVTLLNSNNETVSEWEKKLSSELTTEFWADPIYVPSYQPGNATSRSSGKSSLRYLAENMVGGEHGEGRKKRLEEALWGLIKARDTVEDLKKTSKSNLPGSPASNAIDTALSGDKDAIQGALTDVAGKAIRSGVNSLLGAPIEHPYPQNYPRAKSDSSAVIGAVGSLFGKGDLAETIAFENGNNRVETKETNGSPWKNALSSMANTLGASIGFGSIVGQYNFLDSYVKGALGVQTTLRDLCFDYKPDSLEDLMRTLKASPYITTPSKFMTSEVGRYKSQTLDQNAYWEIILEPFVDKKMNGGLSYLPSIQEINIINLREHGIETGYTYWLPITGFELQKSKMNTKSLGLYDGEITYPISAEFTNEVRLTIVDDIFKSFKRYFETCANVAIYNSEAHNEDYYTTCPSIPTVIDKTHITVALYKNITFRCRIYVMTPQYSTVRQYDLLLVMKDFSEEYMGEIDATASDLTVTFSIVGENPGSVSKQQINAFKAGQENHESLKKSDRKNAGISALKNTISLLS